MIQPNRPVPSAPPAPYAPYPQPQGPAPQVPAVYAPQPYAPQPYGPQAAPANGLGKALDSVMTTVGKVFQSIVDFFKRLFGGTSNPNQVVPGQVVPGQVPAPVAPQPYPQVPVAPQPQQVGPNGLTPEEAQLAAQQGLLATKDNVAAFMREAQGLEQTNALGPGVNNPQAVGELQTLLKQWGYNVNVTGAWDQATSDAVLQFKGQNNLFASYRMANGQPGIHPFIDEATKQAMIRRLQAQPVAPAAVVPQPAPAPQPFPQPAPAPGPAPVGPANVGPQPAPAPVGPQPFPQPAPAPIGPAPNPPVGKSIVGITCHHPAEDCS